MLGKEVFRRDFDIKVEEGINNWQSQDPQAIITQAITGQIRSQVWDQYVRELIMNNEYSKLGIDISNTNLFYFFERLYNPKTHKGILPRLNSERSTAYLERKIVQAMEAVVLFFNQVMECYGGKSGTFRLYKPMAIENILFDPLKELIW